MTTNLPNEIRKATKKLYVITENETVFILADCKVTGGMMKIPMTLDQFQRWQSLGQACIQDVLPELIPEVREVLITGMTPAEWNKTFDEKEFTKEELISKFFYVFED